VSTAATPAPRDRSNPIAVLVRIIVITVAFGILGGGLGALMGILGISIINLAGEHTDMGLAIFVGALPGLVIGAIVGFVVVIAWERRAAR
jgi:hypothetical protein